MTTRDEAIGLATRLVESFNSRRFDDAADLYAPDFITHPFGTGAEAGRHAWELLVAKYPRMRLEVDHISIDGDTVTVRSTVTDTDTDTDTDTLAFGALPILIETFRIADGRFAEWWGSTWLPDLAG
jgi:predicted SnoaL-like aldol condensation-catalyzing enzyme